MTQKDCVSQKAADKSRFNPDESVQSALHQRHQWAIKDFSDKLLAGADWGKTFGAAVDKPADMKCWRFSLSRGN